MPTKSADTHNQMPDDQTDKQTSRVETALTSARGMASDALHESQKAAQRVGKAAEANPLAAVGAGIAVGLAIGALLPKTKRESDVLGPTGRRLTGAATDAMDAAREAAKVELATLPLSKDAARAQVGKVFDQVAKAISGAGDAALSSRSRSNDGSTAVAQAAADPEEKAAPRQRRAK